MREVFMAPFEAVIKEAGIESIMNAYHDLDGILCTVSKELFTEVLRDEWGFDGIVVSDFDSIPMLVQLHHLAKDLAEAAVMAFEAGIDAELPHAFCYGQPLHEAVDKGIVNMELIDKSVSRILKTKFRLGLFENPYVDEAKADEAFETPEHRSLARALALKSMVLLKNSDNLLPLDKDISSIAIIGPNAHKARHMMGDYTYPALLEEGIGEDFDDASKMDGLGPDLIGVSVKTVLDAIKEKVAAGTTVHYAEGCDVMSNSREGFAEAIAAAEKSDVAIVVAGERSGQALSATCGEFRDRSDIGLPGVQKELVQAIRETGKPVVVVLIGGRPLSIPWIAENVPAVLLAWLPGEEGGEAVAEVLFGDYNPGGKLPVTIVRATGQIPTYYNHKPSGGKSFVYGDFVDMSCTPLFAFGHGLSYTRFEYSDLRIEPNKASAGGEIRISVAVKNIGDCEGDEVVQLYVRDADARVTRPVMELKGFKRVTLKPGATRTVTFTLFVNQLGFCDADMRYVVEPGIIEVMIGAASDDVRMEGKFEITGETTDIAASKVFFGTSEVK
jgi:beta-glucosidase